MFSEQLRHAIHHVVFVVQVVIDRGHHILRSKKETFIKHLAIAEPGYRYIMRKTKLRNPVPALKVSKLEITFHVT